MNCARSVPRPARLCPICGARLTKRLVLRRLPVGSIYPALRNGLVITVVLSAVISALTGGFKGSIDYAGVDALSFVWTFGEVAVFIIGASLLLHLFGALDRYFKS